MTHLSRQHVKKQRHYFTDKAPAVGVMVFMVFPVVMYGCGSWAMKKAEDKMFSNCGAREDS